MAPARTVAAFDVDGTLTTRDTLAPFLGRLVGWPALARAALRDAPSIACIVAGRGDRDATKERVLVRLLAGMPYEDVARAGSAYGQHVAARRVRRAMRDRIAWHRGEGHDVVLVSASLDVYLNEVARMLGCDAVLCTQLEVDEAGRCTGRMLGGNCRGPAKADRLDAYLGTDEATIWAYGDSAGDNEMLARAHHATRVHRSLFGRFELRTE